MSDCPVCHRPTVTLLGLPHACPPIWRIWDPLNGDEEDADEVRAYNAVAAATKWADEHDHENDYIALRSGLTVHVRSEDGRLLQFKVTGESLPEYSAREIGEKSDD